MVAASVVISILRERADSSSPPPGPAPQATQQAAFPQPAADPAEDLPPLPPAGNILEASAHTRVRQLVAQYREAVVTGSEPRARATEELILREGAAAAPFLDRTIAESRNADVTAGLTRIRARLPEPIVVTGPLQGPPPP